MLAKYIGLVKDQISYHDYLISKKSHDPTARAKQQKLKSQFQELLEELMFIESHPFAKGCDDTSAFFTKILDHSNSSAVQTPTVSGDLTPEDLEGLPDEILDKLGLKESDRQEMAIVGIIKDLGGAAVIPKIMLKLYEQTGTIPERNVLAAKLYRMTAKGLLQSSNIGKGWYCLPAHESATEKEHDDELDL